MTLLTCSLFQPTPAQATETPFSHPWSAPGIAHSFGAILAGFAAITLLGAAADYLIRRSWPHWFKEGEPHSPAYLSTNLLCTLLFCLAGGSITARLAPTNPITAPLTHAFILALAVLIFGALSFFPRDRSYPLWYQVLLVATSPIALALGGVLIARQL